MLAKPVEMKKVNLTMLDSDAQTAAMTLARMMILHPLDGLQNQQLMPDYPAAPYSDVYHSLHSRFTKITDFVSEGFSQPADLTRLVTLQQLQLMDGQIMALWALVSKVEEQIRLHNEKITATRQLEKSLQKFISLDMDLSRLTRGSRFLQIMVGTVPAVNFSQLKRALSLAEFMINDFYTAEGIKHVVIMGSTLQQRDVHDLLKSADFRELDIPPEFSGNPSKLRLDLEKQLTRSIQEAESVQNKLSDLLRVIQPVLQQASDLLILAQPYASLSMVLKGQGGLVSMQGWVPADSESAIKNQLHKDLTFPFYSKFSSPDIEELNVVPSLLKHSWLFRPFQSLVSNFGIPNYAEVDPTALFSISYILMFGMMFGDIGHGAIIILGSLFLWKRFPAVTIIAVLAGLSSMGFGFVYGSLFGYEHVIQPLWMSPMHDPVQVLLLALVWGALFLLGSNLLSIRNLLAVGLKQQAFYSGKGIAGLMFYLAALYSGYQLMVNNHFALAEMFFLLLPLTIMARFQWLQSSAGLFEKILVVFIEMLEHVISSVSGTLSFLRVAAFSLNHIALASAVFSIAAMMDFTGHWITIVLGNVFIIVLEGAIVAIQCLRLEYYEGFSRFFSGKGKAFEPLKFDI